LDDDFHKLIRSGKKQTFAKLILTRNDDFITLGGKFPRLTKRDAKARFERNQKAAAGDLAPEVR
jgi:N-acetylmuramoyl-L-alanine amidase